MSPTSCQTAPPRNRPAIIEPRAADATRNPLRLGSSGRERRAHNAISGSAKMPRTSTASPLTREHRRARGRPDARCGPSPRLVEIHELDDAQVVERADHREDHGRRSPASHGRRATRAWSTTSFAQKPTNGGTPASENMMHSITSGAATGCAVQALEVVDAFGLEAARATSSMITPKPPRAMST